MGGPRLKRLLSWYSKWRFFFVCVCAIHNFTGETGKIQETKIFKIDEAPIKKKGMPKI